MIDNGSENVDCLGAKGATDFVMIDESLFLLDNGLKRDIDIEIVKKRFP